MQRSRASNRGCLPLPLAEYLELVDRTARQVHHDKRGSIPSELAPIFERPRGIGEGWQNLVRESRRIFRRAAGRPASRRLHAGR
jgi:hypothetical protein